MRMEIEGFSVGRASTVQVKKVSRSLKKIGRFFFYSADMGGHISFKYSV